jgi:dihydrolipoamide dehydrogenase
MRVVLVTEEPRPGGVCLFRGCIPSKALLHVAKTIREARSAAAWGVHFDPPRIDLDALRAFKDRVIEQLVGGIGALCKARNVEVISARGTFLDSGTLRLDAADGTSRTLPFRTAIVATGSSPARPPLFDLGDPRVMDSTGALELRDVPGRLLVVGGGYIGLEMGCVYAALGSRVTVVEMTSGLLPGADRDLVGPLKRRLDADFAAIRLETKVVGLAAGSDGITARFESAAGTTEETFDRVLVAIGRRPNSRGFGLENTRVEVDAKGFVKVDPQRRTTDPRIFAIGDVAGEPMLAHKATREAKVAIESLAGEPAAFDPAAIPAVVFTDPEVAWCGLTETEAKSRGIEVKVVRFPWGASGRAIANGHPEGLTKILCDPQTERVLGVGIVGSGAGELIGEAALAVEQAAVARDVAETIHAHPTLSETFMEAAEAVIGQAVHMVRPRR